MEVYAAGYAGQFSNFLSSNLRDIRLVSDVILAILGCSRMLLMFGTSQSEHYFPLGRHKASMS